MAETILIIEDDPDIAEVLRYSFEVEKFSTQIASTGEEGLRASLDRSNPPSVILLDLLLPGMSGAEICRRLRQEQLTQLIPILVITAKAFELDGTKTLELGANDYIVKPFSVREVVTRVRSLLSQSP